MRFLGLERVDYALVSRLNGMSILNKLGIEGIKVYDPPLEKTCLYHYLHESKSYLIPQLEKVIAALEESGELEQLIREAEAAALDQ